MNKIKAIGSILLMAISFFMTITTKYIRALGDYVLEFFGIQSWTGENTGLHLTVIYFGILFILSLYLVWKYVVDEFNIRRGYILLIFILLMTFFTLFTNITVKNIKKNSNGIFAIGYNYHNQSKVEYNSKDYKYTDFKAEFELTNYSDSKKSFYISIDSPYYRDENVSPIDIYDKDGTKAIFELEGREKRRFIIDIKDYDIVGGLELLNGSGEGIIPEIIISDNEGNRLRLDHEDIFGNKINYNNLL